MVNALFSASLEPPEPARAITEHLVRAATSIARLPRWMERHPLAAMSPSARQLAWAVGRHITRNPDHGFAMAALVPSDAVGSLWPMYEAAPALCALHERYARFSVLLLDFMHASVVPSEYGVLLRHQPEPVIRVDRGEEDFRAAFNVKTWRALHQRDDIAPRAVYFTYARPASTRSHEHMLGTRELHFSQPYFQLELPWSWWHAPLPKADAQRFEQLYRSTCEAVQRYQRNALENRVEALSIELLSTDASAGSIASALGLSERTLRRRLTETGTTLRALLERARNRERELIAEVEQMGGPGTLSATQRARLLGFANAGALRNALRRWTAGRD